MSETKNLTNEKKEMENKPFITLRRIDCQEQKTQTGETYYMFSGLYAGKNRVDLVTFYTRDKDLYADVLAIPMNVEFKLYYDLLHSNTKGFYISPNAVSL